MRFRMYNKNKQSFHDIAARVNTVLQAGQTSYATGLRSSTHLDLFLDIYNLIYIYINFVLLNSR